MIFGRVISEDGSWDIAIASNGMALASTDAQLAPLRQINLATDVLSKRADNPGASVSGSPIVVGGASRSLFLIHESNSSQGLAFAYSAVNNDFSSLRTFGVDLAQQQ